MSKKVDDILKEVLARVEPSKEDLKKIKKSLSQFKEKVEKQIKRHKLDAVIFEGGSFAKKTMIKKDSYDIDIFIRFDEKYKKENISELTGKLFNEIKNISIIHGSRDYFQIKSSQNFFIEVIPVIKVNNPKKAENITDLSYSHVKYINKKIKNPKILDEIKIAKAFCYAAKTYGAESYINGFSGYSLELLIYYYKSFLNFIKAIARHNQGKIIIDIEKYYKNKNDVLLDMNSSKLGSPIILIDPTYKQRNALAALSEETFKRFRQASKKFKRF
ncbi:nucleotidyltransferase domain-containing protein [Candidatus Pacearchaeota archaeon]|nr:nucleotidyltransferase domain-containing protein [Candidatus Pacearchaeota archaeon]